MYRSYTLPAWRFYDLLRMFGTVEETAKLLKERGYDPPPAQTIQGWRNRNLMPAPWVPVFLKMALEGEFITDIDDLKAK